MVNPKAAEDRKSLNVKISPIVRKKLRSLALDKDITLQTLVEQLLEDVASNPKRYGEVWS